MDRVAAAVFDLSQRQGVRGSLEDAARSLARVEQLATSARDPVLDRCAEIARWVERLVLEVDAETVVIEMPAKDGAYFRLQKLQATKGAINGRAEAMLNRAIGAIAAGAHAAGAQLRELSSATYARPFRDKNDRHEALNAALRRIGREPLKGNQDTRDAAFIGVFYLAMEGL